MHSSSLIFSLSPFISKSLFELVCDELGWEYTERESLTGKARMLSGDRAAFGRACYAVIAVTPISEIRGAVQRSIYSGRVNSQDFIDVIRYYLYTPEFREDLSKVVSLSKDVNPEYPASAMRKDAETAHDVLESVSTNDLGIADAVIEVINRTYAKGCQLTLGVNIFMLYSRASQMRLGLRRSAVFKKKAGKGSNNSVLFRQNPELGTALENDYWDWLRTKMSIDPERDDTIIMTKVMGMFLNSYFLPYWFKNLMPKHVNNSMGTIYKGEVLSQADLLTLPVTPYMEVDVRSILQRAHILSSEMFSHSKAALQGASNDVQYTIIEYYVEKMLNKQIGELSNIATRTLKRARVNMFLLDTGYEAGRISNVGGTADASFTKRVSMNRELIREVDTLRSNLTLNNIRRIYRHIAALSLNNSDVANSNKPYVDPRTMKDLGGATDGMYSKVGAIVQCLCDLDSLNAALHAYGLSIIDLFSIGKLGPQFYNNITGIESLVLALRTQSVKNPIDTDDGIYPPYYYKGMSWYELGNYLPLAMTRSSDGALQRITNIGKPNIRSFNQRNKSGNALFDPIMGRIQHMHAMAQIPAALQFANLLYQLTPGTFSLTSSQLVYDIDVTECRELDDNGEVAYDKIINSYNVTWYAMGCFDLSRFFLDTKRNPFARVVGARYILAQNSAAFMKLFGQNIYSTMFNIGIKYIDSETKKAIPVSKVTRSVAADTSHPNLGESGETYLLNHVQSDIIDNLLAQRNQKVQSTIQASKSSNFLDMFAEMQRDDLPGLMFETVAQATYDVGRMGLRQYILSRQAANGIQASSTNNYYIPMEFMNGKGDTSPVLCYPLTNSGQTVYVQSGVPISEEELGTSIDSASLARTMAGYLKFFKDTTGPYYPIIAPTAVVLKGLRMYCRELLRRLFGNEAPEYYYIMDSVMSMTDFFMTYMIVSASIHDRLNSYYDGHNGIHELIEGVVSKYRDSCTAPDDTQRCYVELGMHLLTLKRKLDSFAAFRDSLLCITQHRGTGQLENVLYTLYNNGITGYKNTAMLCSEYSELYSQMQTDIIVATTAYVLQSEAAAWSQLSSELNFRYHEIRGFVERATGLAAVTSTLALTEQDIYPLYRSNLIKALQSEEFIQQTLCLATSIKSVDFEVFKEDKLVDNDGFLLYENGRHYYQTKENNITVFVHNSGLMFYVTLSANHVDIHPFDIEMLED